MQQIVFLATGIYFCWFFYVGFLFSVSVSIKFGMGDYSKFKPSGPYRVGYKEFTTKELSNDCSIFYPAAPDGSGKFGVPFLLYGEKQIEGLKLIVGADLPPWIAFVAKIILRSMLSIKVPVYRDATIGKKMMQPVVFSHGLSAQRMIYSSLYMEMASCGYCVIALSHNDQSSDYTPKADFYDA